MIRVELPGHLRALAHVKGEVVVDVAGTVSVLSVIDALEAQYPMLRACVTPRLASSSSTSVLAISCASITGQCSRPREPTGGHSYPR